MYFKRTTFQMGDCEILPHQLKQQEVTGCHPATNKDPLGFHKQHERIYFIYLNTRLSKISERKKRLISPEDHYLEIN